VNISDFITPDRVIVDLKTATKPHLLPSLPGAPPAPTSSPLPVLIVEQLRAADAAPEPAAIPSTHATRDPKPAYE
jgi:hypothetical protein